MEKQRRSWTTWGVWGLAGLIGVGGYAHFRDYLRYGLAAAYIEETDPFRVHHGARLSIPNEHLTYGAPKDHIPALDHPKFLDPEEQRPWWLTDQTRVLGIEHGAVAKAYPVPILLYHEIVNDEVGGKPYLVTY